MPEKKTSFADIALQTLIAAAIVLFFACFGDAHGSFLAACHNIRQLVQDTVTGQNLREHYWTVTVPQILYSLRLVLVAFLLAVTLGISLGLARVRIQNRIWRTVTDAVASLLESMPEAMYVIIVVVITLVFLNWGVVIPAFSASNPKWSETFIPALALSLSGAFYLQRVLSLQLQDEFGADYVRTASSKGASDRRVFYRHLVPNLGPAMLRQLPVIAALILSSAIFAEYFLEYPGALFIFTNFATGWDYGTGIPLTLPKPTGLPELQHGLVFVIGILMVGFWLLIRVITNALYRARYPDNTLSKMPAGYKHRLRWPSLIAGVVMLGIVLAIGLDPHLVSPWNPNQPIHVTLFQVLGTRSPTLSHPFGVDDYGRDLLAEAAGGTFRTLWPVVVITVITVAASLSIAILSHATESKWLQRAIRSIGESLTGVPVLFILFLALYTKNPDSPSQTLDFILWVAAAEAGRGAFAFQRAMQGWNQFVFIEGATSIGRSRIGTLFGHLRSWLGYYTLEYGFTEIARVLTIMTQLAAFHLYISEKIGHLPFSAPLQGIVATRQTWVSMIGDATAGMSYVSVPDILFAPVVFLLFTVIGANLVARGIRG